MKWDLDSHTSSRSLTHPAGNLNNKPAARNDHTTQPETEPALNRFALKPLVLGVPACRRLSRTTRQPNRCVTNAFSRFLAACGRPRTTQSTVPPRAIRGPCQICGETFIKRDETPYFEGLYLVSRTKARWTDRPGNAICLCATCCAKFQQGTVVADDILVQIGTWRPQREGGGDARLTLQLCGEHVALRFTEKHLLDLQEIIKAACP